MPQGPGTYGSQVGRPPKPRQKKTVGGVLRAGKALAKKVKPKAAGMGKVLKKIVKGARRIKG